MQDANYNVIGVVNSSGRQVERYEYTPYGERIIYGRPTVLTDLQEATTWFNDAMLTYPQLTSARLTNTTPVSLCDFGHQGLKLDQETDQYDNRKRMYIPRHGRFPQRDPWGDIDGQSLYQYCGNNPVTRIDHAGRAWEVVENPTKIEIIQVPPLEKRKVKRSTGENGADWFFKATPIHEKEYYIKNSSEICCRIDVKGSLKDRWYWAMDSDAKKEELRELGMEAEAWREFIRMLKKEPFYIPIRDNAVFPCDIAYPLARFLQVRSYAAKYAILADIFAEDMENHPTDRYRQALATYDGLFQEYVAKANDAFAEMKEAEKKYRKYKNTNTAPCCRK